MIEPTEKDIGRAVVNDDGEWGILKGFNGERAVVQFAEETATRSCDPKKLVWEDQREDDKSQ